MLLSLLDTSLSDLRLAEHIQKPPHCLDWKEGEGRGGRVLASPVPDSERLPRVPLARLGHGSHLWHRWVPHIDLSASVAEDWKEECDWEAAVPSGVEIVS